MKHIQVLKTLSVFRDRNEIDLVKILEDGTRQIPTVDIYQPITPERCAELVERAEKRTGVELSQLTIKVSFWEFSDKDEFLEYEKKGFAFELSPVNVLTDEYEFTKSDGYLELIRTVDTTLYPHAWIDGGFRKVDYFNKPIGDIIEPNLKYKELLNY